VSPSLRGRRPRDQRRRLRSGRKEKAVRKAVKLRGGAWHLLPFDDENYRPHVEECHSQLDVEANCEPDERKAYVENLKSPESTEEIDYVRYLLLYADVAGGDGRVIFEPWFPTRDPQLLEHDLATDWVDTLVRLRDEGLQNFEDFATRQSAQEEDAKPDHLRPIIIPFPSQTAQAPDPRQYRTEIPEFRAMPLSRAQFGDVCACLTSIDHILSKPQTVAMRTELAAALLAHACAAGYESAAAQGKPEEAQMRYDAFERLAVLRARHRTGTPRND
jgi:hypothetical protein